MLSSCNFAFFGENFKKESFVSETMTAANISKKPPSVLSVRDSFKKIIPNAVPKRDSSDIISEALAGGEYF